MDNHTKVMEEARDYTIAQAAKRLMSLGFTIQAIMSTLERTIYENIMNIATGDASDLDIVIIVAHALPDSKSEDVFCL